MTAFRILLVAFTIGILTYTGIAGANHGWDLLSVFVGNIKDLTWSGQFNLDFMCYLILSGIWVAWRNDFSAAGIGLGAIASVLGILFLAPYLLWTSFQTDGDMKQLLLGARRAASGA